MTPQERELLIQMFQRIDAAGDQPRDREAEDLIADAVRQLPFAPYLLAQTVLVQEEALKAAAARIEQLEAELKKMDEPPRGGSFLGSGSSIFGSRPSTSGPSSGTSPWGRNARDAMQDQAAPAPFPSTAPQQPMAQAAAAPQGNSFLRGALGAAAGVAGGMLLANSIRGLFDNPNTSRNDQLGIAGGLDRNADSSNVGAPDMSDIFPASGSADDSYSSDFDSGDSTDI